MKIIQAGYKILRPKDWESGKQAIYEIIEEAGRTCYKSESAITPESSAMLVKHLMTNGHESVLEHAHMTVRFTVDRGVSHELVRHRLASYSQESTRYCNYSKDKFGNELTFIEPLFFKNLSEDDKDYLLQSISMENYRYLCEAGLNALQWNYVSWARTCMTAEAEYMSMLQHGAKPEEARDILPISLKTEVVMTANMREWRNVFRLRAAGERGKPHPQMAEVMVPLFKECREHMPELFGDILLPEERK